MMFTVTYICMRISFFGTIKSSRIRAINQGFHECRLHDMHCSGQCFVVCLQLPVSVVLQLWSKDNHLSRIMFYGFVTHNPFGPGMHCVCGGLLIEQRFVHETFLESLEMPVTMSY